MTTHDLADDVPVIDLDALERPAGKIKLRRRTTSADGEEAVEWLLHDVMPMDGRAADILREYFDRAKSGTQANVSDATLRSIARDCVPSLTRDEVRWLTPKQLVIIFGLAAKQTELVAQFIAAMHAHDDASANESSEADGAAKNDDRPTSAAATPAADTSRTA